MSWRDVFIMFDTLRKKTNISAKEHTIMNLLFMQVSKNLESIPLKNMTRIVFSVHRMGHYLLTPA
jgi:hypothetical protein